MKIAFIIPSLLPGGAERVIVTLANKFSLNSSVILIVLFKTEVFYSINQNVKVIFLHNEIKKSTSKLNAIIYNIQNIISIYNILKNENINTSISFTTTMNIYNILTTKFLKIKCIISERNNPIVTQLNLFLLTFRRLLYPFCDNLVVQSKFSKDYFKKILNSDKIKIIHNPINEDLLKYKNEYLQRENILLTVGRLEANKNHKLLLNAFSKIKNDWKLILVGDGKLKDDLIKLSVDLKINDRVEFIGHSKEIYKFLNISSLFVFTSNSEGFPNVLLEAVAFNLPTISTNCNSGPSDLIIDNFNGFLTPVNSEKELIESLNLLMSDASLRHKFSINSKEIIKKFKIEVIYNEWKKLI